MLSVSRTLLVGLPTCKFVQKTQSPAARNAHPVAKPILLFLFTLRFGCPLFGNDGVGSRIVSAFESLQDMKVSFINGAMLIIMNECGNPVWIAKCVESKCGLYAERKPLMPHSFPQDRHCAGISRDRKLPNEANCVGLTQGLSALQIGFHCGRQSIDISLRKIVPPRRYLVPSRSNGFRYNPEGQILIWS